MGIIIFVPYRVPRSLQVASPKLLTRYVCVWRVSVWTIRQQAPRFIRSIFFSDWSLRDHSKMTYFLRYRLMIQYSKLSMGKSDATLHEMFKTLYPSDREGERKLSIFLG